MKLVKSDQYIEVHMPTYHMQIFLIFLFSLLSES